MCNFHLQVQCYIHCAVSVYWTPTTLWSDSRQLCSKKKAKIYVVSGIGTIKGDSTLVYRINRDISSETSVSILHGNGYNPVYKF